MHGYATVFLLIALVDVIIGYRSIEGRTARSARVLSLLFLALSVISLSLTQ
jgi:uncharacterized membrane protein YtjA (UPF0391 family)